MVGKTLGHYEILEPLGAGGMGEVYRARDTKLERDVAIKVLPEGLADDPDRLARLEREAKLLAALNHPHIATIHSLEEQEGSRFLVLELIKGKSLEEHLAAGPLGFDKALEVCKQIAAALEAAHGEGIIHRDLKPANVLITPDGRAKVLDFGLAKSFESTETDADLTRSPTVNVAATQTGVILGTAPYMSPEQVRGTVLDTRTDIWSFGCVLYEVLTGERAFGRETIADTLAAVIEAEPDWDRLPLDTPRALWALIERCVRKDRDRRLRDIGDARIEIEDALSGASMSMPASADGTVVPGAEPSGAMGRQIPLAWAAMAVVVVAAAASLAGWAVWGAARLPESEPWVQTSILVPIDIPASRMRQPSLSPDGRQLAYQRDLRDGGGRPIYLRAMDSGETAPIPGTEDIGVRAERPFFSPDSQWLGYSTREGLWKIPVVGGTPDKIYGALASASWGSDDQIIFSHVGADPEDGSIWRVSASGGEEPELVAEPDPQSDIVRYLRPSFLPGGRDVLVEIRRGSGGLETAGIAVVSLDTGKATIIADKGTDPSYAPTGHIIYARDNSLEAVPFDPQRLERSGPAVQLGREVAVMNELSRGAGGAHYTFSQSGQLVYVQSFDPVDIRRQMVWVDRQGNETLVDDQEPNFAAVRLSPDGSQIAVEVVVGRQGGKSIRLFGIEDGAWEPFTVEGGFASSPVWTLDGDGLLYAYFPPDSSSGGIYSKTVGFGAAQEKILEMEYTHPTSIARSGELLLHEMVDGNLRGRRILVMPMNGDSTPDSPLRDSGEFNQRGAMASPDGPWVAYVDELSGRDEVYVRSFPDFADSYRISDAGGLAPMWGRNDTELFYQDGERMILARLQLEPEFSVVERVPLFEDVYYTYSVRTYYDYDPINDRFLMIKTLPPEVDPKQYTVVTNWFEELKRLAPRGR